MTEESVSLGSAGRLVNVSTGTIRYWILTGRLPAKKVGFHWVINADDVKRVSEEMRHVRQPGNRGRRGKYIPLEAIENEDVH